MARRKKQPISEHRRAITSAAGPLFMENGIAATSMDDIARAAGYSKATLYVYFKDKEEIVSLLVLESMQRLFGCISAALEQQDSTKARYRLICRSLVQYQDDFPFYFGLVLDKINIDFETRDYLPEEKETYRIGEEINAKLKEFLISGIKKGDLRKDMEIIPSIFTFWGMLSGFIQLSSNKEAYLERTTGLSRNQFLEHGFDMLYRSIENQEVSQ